MELQRINEETKQKLHEVITELKENKKLPHNGLENLEVLKIKRSVITQKIEQIDIQYSKNVLVSEKYELLRKQYDLDLEILKITYDIERKKLYSRRLQYLNFISQLSFNSNYIVINDKAEGPYTLAILKQMIQNKQINPSTYVWKQGMESWMSANEVDELKEIVAINIPPIPKK